MSTSTRTTPFEPFGFGVPWEEIASYSQALRAGNLIFVSGQASHAPDGTFIGEGDIEAQCEATFANLDRVLEHYGAKRTDIAEINVFLIDLRENWTATAAAYRTYFGDHRPANNSIGVSSLVLPEQLIEIAATVVLEDR